VGTIRVCVVGCLVGMLLVACSTETDLTIVAQGENAEGETVPLQNVTLDVIPYDIDGLYRDLQEQTQPGPPPSADSISVLAREYQNTCASYRATSDSIEMVQERARAIEDQTSDEYHRVFEQYQQLVSREEERFAECQNVTDAYTEVRESYRERRREWEARAWPEEEFTAAENTLVGEKPVQTVETGPEGTARLTVPNGTWWALGTAPVPGSISQQYRWNVRIEAEGGQDTVLLSSENAELRPVF